MQCKSKYEEIFEHKTNVFAHAGAAIIKKPVSSRHINRQYIHMTAVKSLLNWNERNIGV